MFIVLLACFTILPLLELVVVIKAGTLFGAWNTIGLLLAIGLLGAWLARRQGRALWRKVVTELEQGRLPTDQILHGFLILIGGLLMVTPGFITDVFGLFLVIPFTRLVCLRFFKLWLAKKLQKGSIRFYSNVRTTGPETKSNHLRLVRDVTPPSDPSKMS